MKTSAGNTATDALPLKYGLGREYALSAAIAILMALVSVAGIGFRGTYYPPGEVSIGFVATDLINLGVGLPILLVSMQLARRQKLAGLLCWPGVLFFALYNYIGYLALPMQVLLLPHMLLIALIVYSVIAIIVKIDSEAVRRRIGGTVPVKSTGCILTGIAILVIVYQVMNIVTAIINQASPERVEFMQWLDDLVVGCPALLGGGYLLLRRKALGYVAGAGLLLMCSLLFIGVIPAMVFQALSAGTPVDVIGILVVLVTGMVCFIPFVQFVRGVAKTDQ